jgi:hypothetical protein
MLLVVYVLFPCVTHPNRPLQLLTGSLPIFKGMTPEICDNLQLVHAILTLVPVSPAQLRPNDVPLVLSHIVMKVREERNEQWHAASVACGNG